MKLSLLCLFDHVIYLIIPYLITYVMVLLALLCINTHVFVYILLIHFRGQDTYLCTLE